MRTGETVKLIAWSLRWYLHKSKYRGVYFQNSICSHYSMNTITFADDHIFVNSQNNEKVVQVLESHGSNQLMASRKLYSDL